MTYDGTDIREIAAKIEFVHGNQQREAAHWCRDWFGPPGRNWRRYNRQFWFRNPGDQMLFRLRWHDHKGRGQ